MTGFRNFILRGNLVELAVAFIMATAFAAVVLAAIVYFLVVKPYTAARERFFPSPEPGTPEDVELLRQIRDLLASQTGGTHSAGTPTP
jgi:large conductance mechanosensitive channel